MDRKTILALAGAFALLYLWMWGVGKIFPPVPKPGATNGVARATNPPAAAPEATPSVITAAPTNQFAPPVTPDAPEETVSLENDEAIYTFTSYGGGLKQVKLKKYIETIRSSRVQGTNDLVTLNEDAPAPVLALRADGVLGDHLFRLTKTRTNTLIAESTTPSGLRVVKEFMPGSNYAMQARVWFENTSSEPMSFPQQQLSVGTATLAGPEDNPAYMGIFWYNGAKAEHIQQPWFENRTMGCLWSNPREHYTSGQNTIAWAAVHSQFFALAVVPGTNAYAAQFTAQRVLLSHGGKGTNGAAKPEFGFQAAIHYPPFTLTPGQILQRDYAIYAGPKQEKTLSRLGRNLDAIMDFGWFGAISKVFLRAMNGLHRWGLPYGVAIIIITVIIKLVFWPLTQASTRSMKRMQALGPEMKLLQAKYKDDPQKLNKKMMEFWREHKVNPMSGCWPMLVQLPIFFALFRMIPNAIELRGTPFLWIQDLSRPDTIFYLPGFDFPFNPLPLLMGATMLWQARLTPMAPGADPAQQAMMKYMPLIFLVFLYTQPAGLTLYWTVQNLLTILQMKLTKAKDAAATITPAPAPVAVPKKQKKK